MNADFGKLIDMCYERWQKDDCDDITEEIFDYMVYKTVLSNVMDLDDEEITKEKILEIAGEVIKDESVIEDARELSDCLTDDCDYE